MRQSQLFTKTRREAPSDEVSKNAQLLVRGGYIHKEMAGVYSYLPLGLRVFKKVEQIVREEMNKIGGQEMVMTALQDKEVWEKTGRWDDAVVDNWFKTKLKNDTELGLAYTHEPAITQLMKGYVSSYRDLPTAAYQFQLKFRNELRAKSGIFRLRQFTMKDLYSFSKNQKELDTFYEAAIEAYRAVFNRVGLGDKTYLTLASGGSFGTKFSHEFQTLTSAGEDTIYIHEGRKLAVNKEVYSDETLSELGLRKEDLREEKAVEVGNIYKLGTFYSEPLGLTFKDEAGANQPVIMGSYGIGIDRLIGTAVEVFADDKGIVWPEALAPFRVHLVDLSAGNEEVQKDAQELYRELTEAGVEVLWDDRDVRAGEKFADSDLLGIPLRVIVSQKSLEAGRYECVERASGTAAHKTLSELLSHLRAD